VTTAAVLLAFWIPPPSLKHSIITAVIAVAEYLLALTGIELVFRPGSRPWFDGRRNLDSKIFS